MFISDDNVLRTHSQKNIIHLDELGTNIVTLLNFGTDLPLNLSICRIFMNAVKHLKDPYDNIREQISYNSFFPEMFSDIGNLDVESSNL